MNKKFPILCQIEDCPRVAQIKYYFTIPEQYKTYHQYNNFLGELLSSHPDSLYSKKSGINTRYRCVLHSIDQIPYGIKISRIEKRDQGWMLPMIL